MIHQPKHPLIAVVALALIEFACSLDWMGLNSIGGALMRDLQLSPASYAVLVSAGSVAAGAGGLLVAGIIDRFERRRVTELMLLGLLVVSLLITQTTNYWLLLTLRAAAGLCGATAGSLAYAMVADLFEPARQPRAYAFVISGFSLSLGLGIPALVSIEAHAGWHAMYYLIATLLGVTLVLVRLQIPVLEAHPGQAPLRQLQQMLSHRPHQLSLLLMSVVMGCGWMLMPFIAPYFTYTLKMAPQQIAMFYFYSGIAVVFCNFLVSTLVARWSAQRVLLAVIICALPLQWLVTTLHDTTVVHALTVAVTFYACSVTRWNLCNQLTSRHILPSMRGGMMSLSFAMQECAGGLVVTLAGTLLSMENGQLVGYARIGALSIACNGVLLVLLRQLSRQRLPDPA